MLIRALIPSARSWMERFKKYVLLFSGSYLILTKMAALTFYMGAIGGYLFAKYLSGKMEGESGRLKSIVFSLGSYRIHIHHWLLSTLSLFSLWLHGFHTHFFEIFVPVFGFCMAVIFHGIYHYTDWYKVLYRDGKVCLLSEEKTRQPLSPKSV